MTGSAGKCGKGHDEYTGANGGFQLVAKNGGEDQKHHHAAAGSHKAADQADDDSAENGLDDPGLLSTAIIVSLVVMTGFTINLIPRSMVITVEKLPMVFPEINLKESWQ